MYTNGKISKREVSRDTFRKGKHMLRKIASGLAGAVTVLGVSWGAAAVAHAAPTSVTAHTYVTSRPDGGHGTPVTWAFDDFTRTLTVTVNAVQNPADTAAHLTDYTAVITDHGQFHAVLGAGTPNQAAPWTGAHITHSVSGEMDGTYTIAVTAPAADTLTGTVPATEDDNFTVPANTTTNWPKLAFATATGVTVTGGAYSWTYEGKCETWTDSSANGDGNLPGDGNITGRDCTPAKPPVHKHDRDRDDHGKRDGHHGRDSRA